MCKTKSFILFLILLIPAICWSQHTLKANYEPGVVVFKLKQSLSSTYAIRELSGATPHATAENLMKKVGAAKVIQPFATPKNAKNTIQLQKQVSSSLDGIFKMELPEGLSVEDVISILKREPEILYAEPYYLPQLLEIPNDSSLTKQTYLPVIKADQAWEIQKGSRDIIIGILDSGVDFNHPDLQGNLHLNENDPIDGIDNDGDGFIDNYRGWDFGNADNYPQADNNVHGTVVTGVCSATTNNITGIAGTGYNTRYMPIKVFSSRNGSFVNGYEAIVYAANMGCKVINLSWGAPSAPSEYVQDIINYAVNEKDVVIVAAGGNTKGELDFYPASYNNVLSVTSTENNDVKASWSSWSRFIDLVAPGTVLSTTNGNGYLTTSGTSFSSPMVAGAAALVRAQFPELNAKQVMERLRRSADDVYHIGTNATYQDRLGRGRLNMLTALQGSVGPAVRMNKFDYNNGVGKYAFHSDTVQIWMDFTNYLDAASDVKVKLISESSYATVIDAEIALGPLNTLQNTSNKAKPFSFYLDPKLPALAFLSFRIEFSTADGYKDYQYFNFRTSGDYIDFRVDDLTLTIASNGNLGYNYDYNLQGLGLRYQNSPLAHNMGLLIGQNQKAVANNIINRSEPVRRDQDFKIVDRLRLYNHTQADLDARSSFEVVVTDSTRMNLRIDQKVLGWSDPADGTAVVLEYRITNRSDTAYKNLHVALFSDFNLTDFFLNRASWDAAHQLGYTYNDVTQRYAGIALITTQPLLYHALDVNSREGNTAEISTTISRKQKWGFISNGISKTEAGVKGKGNDVAKFLGGTISNLAPKNTEKVAFAMVTASTLEGLQAATLKARQNYKTYLDVIPLLLRTEACESTPFDVIPTPGSRYRFYSKKEAIAPIAEGEKITFTSLQKDTTIYAVNIQHPWAGEIQRIEIKVNKSSVDFDMSSELLVLNAGLDETVTFTGISPEATKWMWNFGNGMQSELQNPTVPFTAVGTYTVSLSTTATSGCVKTIERTLTVVRKEEVPAISNLSLCLQEEAVLVDANGRAINIYADTEKQTLLHSGLEYKSEPLTASKQFFVTSGSGVTESDLQAVSVEVFKRSIEISHEVIIDPDNRYQLEVSAMAESAEEVTAVNWYQNGVLIGSGNTVPLAYDGVTALTVTAVVNFANGCEQQIQQQLPLVVAALPKVGEINICKGEAPLVAPEVEGLYYFYADAALENLLYKGRSYQSATIEASQSLYITNMTGGLESEAVQLHIRTQEGLANFHKPADTISLEKEALASFTGTSPEAVAWLWNFGDGNISTEQNPTHTYTVAGTYAVSLIAINARGCQDITQQEIVIAKPQGMVDQVANHLQFYPNPTNGPLNIQIPANLQPTAYILVMDLTGRQLWRQSVTTNENLQLNIETYAKGTYLIRLINAKQVWQSRVVKQ